jgi:hypothetical protein
MMHRVFHIGLAIGLAISPLSYSHAQLFGPAKDISLSVSSPVWIHTTDLNGDGRVDVLYAGQGDGKIAWYENLGGGVFGPQRIIADVLRGARSVHAADLDGDTDVDVMGVFEVDNKIVWFENWGMAPSSPNRSSRMKYRCPDR